MLSFENIKAAFGLLNENGQKAIQTITESDDRADFLNELGDIFAWAGRYEDAINNVAEYFDPSTYDTPISWTIDEKTIKTSYRTLVFSKKTLFGSLRFEYDIFNFLQVYYTDRHGETLNITYEESFEEKITEGLEYVMAETLGDVYEDDF